MDIHIRTGALLRWLSLSLFCHHTHPLPPTYSLALSLSLACLLFLLSLIWIYLYILFRIVLLCACISLSVCVFVCVRVGALLCATVPKLPALLWFFGTEQYANPFFVQRYDTLLMLHFRFATRMTASIWLCLATNTHTIQSITFPSQFFLVAAAVGVAAPCAFFTVGLPHRNRERTAHSRIFCQWNITIERIEGCWRSCNLSFSLFFIVSIIFLLYFFFTHSLTHSPTLTRLLAGNTNALC